MRKSKLKASLVEGKSFGQRVPPLTEFLKSILERYPDGGQILKEIIQNADDAGAKTCTFLLDSRKRPYGTSSLLNEGLEEFQGPALYAQNDAIFQEKDWEGIESLMQSNKEKNLFKIGRFGIGFNSVYHVTDLPSIVSGTYLAFLDPHEKYFQKGETGQKFDLNYPLLPNFYDQFSPFEDVLDCKISRGYYKGTLFRFPLRNNPSKLSSKPYRFEGVRDLFIALKEEAAVILLFLKNIEKICLYETDERVKEKHLFTVKISDDCAEEVRQRRQEFLKEADELLRLGQRDNALMTMVMTICECGPIATSLVANRKWLVCNCVSTVNERVQQLSAELKLPPWMGVARPLSLADCKALEKSSGRLFCFLPLPPDVSTGLPVHINGFFGLTDNRFGLKWPGPECRDDAAKWNELLLENVGSVAYEKLILYLQNDFPEIPSQDRVSNFYMSWPQLNRVQTQWFPMLERMFSSLAYKEVFYTEVNGGKWINPEDSLLERLASDATDDVRETVVSLLKSVSRPVVTLPDNLLKIVDDYMSYITTTVTPEIVRELIKNGCPVLHSLERKDKLQLLEYVLSDKCYSDLCGVPLLPLANGQFVKFYPRNNCSSSDDFVYVASKTHPQAVLPNMHSKFLDENIPLNILDVLRSLADSCNSKSRCFQLVALNTKLVQSLLRKVLPKEWFNAHDRVKWYPGKSDHPPETWLESVWDWMKAQTPKHKLVNFEGFPFLIDVSGKTKVLVKIKRNGKTIRESSYGSRLPEDVVSVLKEAGCNTISNVPPYMENYPHLQDCVAPPTPDGVLRVLTALGAPAIVERIISSCSVQKKRKLRSFLLSKQINSSLKELLVQLPIYESMDGKTLLAVRRNGKLASVSPEYLSLPSGISVANAQRILSGSDKDNQKLLEQLKVQLMSNTTFLRRQILPYIDDYCYEDVLKLGVWFLMYFDIFRNEDSSFSRALRHVKFVSVESKRLRAPCELYDPRETLLRKLFDGETEKFPLGIFGEERSLIILQELGMKSFTSVAASDIVHIAENVASFNEEVRINKTNAVLGILNSNSKLLDENVSTNTTLASHISGIPWLPRLASPPSSYPKEMTWFSAEEQLYCPTEIVTLNHANLVGSSMPVLPAFESRSTRLCEAFNWMNPSIESVLQQLRDACKCVPIHENLQPFKKMIKEIYDFLSNELPVIQEDDSIKQILEHEPMVFVENCFVIGRRVSFKWKSDGAPYLYGVPEWARKYGSLLKLFGVRENFPTTDFVQALVRMKEEKEQTPLNYQEFIVAKTFILALAGESQETLRAYHGCVPVLNEKRVLQPANKLVINNTPWVNADANTLSVNKDIPVDLAYKLGAKPLLDKKLERYRNQFWKPYGQVQHLTDQLKGILKAYPCDVGILKELLQNADDAKATEIHFIYDTRDLPKKHIFQGEGNWKELQGPALCVYNNRPFKEEDIEGLRSLGVGSKVDDAEKIGRYGIGFNAVYHLTDCPSFLSDDDTLGILDPQACYAPGATQQSPGALFEHIDKELRTDCKDVMQGFNFSGNLQLKGATLFRFPLRNRSMASKSKISDMPGLDKIKHLLLKFQNEARDMFLFLNHITKVTISYFRNGNFDVKYRVFTKLTSKNQQKREGLANHAKVSKSVHTKDIKCFQVTYPITTRDSRKQKQEWLIHQRIGCENKLSDIPDGNDSGLLPRAGVAAKLSDSQWLSTSSINSTGQAFCFLPLPVDTQLPVHVNGHFILDSARRNLWKDKGDEGERTVWNRYIKTKVLAEAYLSLLVAAKDYVPDGEEPNSSKVIWFLNLFPIVDKVGSDWKELAISVYQLIANKDICLLPHTLKNLSPVSNPSVHRYTHSWLSLSSVYFKDPDWLGNDEEITKLLLATGFPLVNYSWLQSSFKAANVSVKHVNPNEVIRFLKDCCFDLARVASIKDVALLLKYCLQSSTFCAQVEGLPLLVTSDNIFRKFTFIRSVFPTTFSDLVPSRKDLFLHHKLYDVLLEVKNAKTKVLEPFDVSSLCLLLPNVLPLQWRNANRVCWNPEQDKIPNVNWFNRLWEFLTANVNEDSPLNCLNALQEWPIFPSSNGELVSASVSKSILNLSFSKYWSPNQRCIVRIINKLKCSQIAFELFEDHIKDAVARLIHDYVAHPNSPTDVLSVLGQKIDKESIAGKLKEEEMLRLLQFFQQDDDTLEEQKLDVSILKRLPFYKTVDGRFVSLAEYETFYVLPQNVPVDDLEPWMIRKKCSFLAQCHQLDILYNYLGVTERTAVEFYISFIFPIFQELEENIRLKHLLFLKDQLVPLLNDNEKEVIFGHLRSLPIICDKHGVLKLASYFYNPSNNVYKTFVSEEQHLPERFRDSSWICFLKSIGLNTEITTTEFEEYTKVVARLSLSPEHRPTLVTYSECLVNCLMDSQDKAFREQSFLKRVSQIAFVPSECPDEALVELQLQPQFKDRIPLAFIPFRDSVPCTAQRLVWTSCNLIPSWAVPKETFLSDCLGIHIAPPLNKVLDHLTNLSTALHLSQDRELPYSQRHLLQEVTLEIYTFLTKDCSCFSKLWENDCTDSCEELSQRLRNSSFLLIEDGHEFVKASQLVLKLDKEIPPYLYKLPRDYVFFEHLLKKVGASESPKPSQYAFVLERIKKACNDSKLEPNSKERAENAVCGLFQTLQKLFEDAKPKYTKKNVVDMGGLLAEVHESLLTVQKLYLLDANGVLKCSTDLIHLNNPSYIGSVSTSNYSILRTPNECGAQFQSDESLLELLPDRLAVPPFRSHFVEKIYPNSVKDICIAKQDNVRCPFVNGYLTLLLSPDFVEGYERIIQHESRGAKVSRQILEQFQANLKVVCLRSLRTHLVSLKDGAEVPNSIQQKDLFVYSNQNSDELIVYFNHGAKREMLNIFLCKEIQRVIHHCLTQESHLLAILSCDTPDEIEGVLDKLDVASFATKNVGLELGNKIPAHFHYYLQQDSSFFFRDKEIVGFLKQNTSDFQEETSQKINEEGWETVSSGSDDEDDDNHDDDNDDDGDGDNDDDDDDGGGDDDGDDDDDDSLIKVESNNTAVDVDNEEEEEEEEECQKDETLQPWFVMAKVIRKVETTYSETSQYLKRYVIDIGDKEVQAGVLDLYKFVQPPVGNAQQSMGDQTPATEEIDVIIQSLKSELEEIWSLPDDERKKATRRLYLRWHPDRNPQNIDQATAVTQFMESEIRRLGEKSNEVPDFSSWSHVAKKQRQSFENYQRHHPTHVSARSTSSVAAFDLCRQIQRTGTGYLHCNSSEARRWIKQAREDLRSAQHCLSADPPLFYMTCFQSQQVVEKTLKAAMYSYCGLADEQLVSHDLLSLAREVQTILDRPIDVYTLAATVRDYYIPTRYPNQHRPPNVPAQMYTRDNAYSALQAATTVLEELQRFIGIPM